MAPQSFPIIFRLCSVFRYECEICSKVFNSVAAARACVDHHIRLSRSQSLPALDTSLSDFVVEGSDGDNGDSQAPGGQLQSGKTSLGKIV